MGNFQLGITRTKSVKSSCAESLDKTFRLYQEKIKRDYNNKIKRNKKILKIKTKRDLKKEFVLSKYCIGTIKCACCGETKLELLTLDHINNDGGSLRKQIKGHGNLYHWLPKHHFPSGFQVLCYNCNIGKFRCGGKCPHEFTTLNNDWELEL